jgi:hypothetical protein
MSVLQRLKHDLKAGWATLRHGTAQAANRALEEAELLRLRLELRKLDQRLHDVWRDIGERAVELHDRGEPGDRIMADFDIGRSMEQVQRLKEERAKLLADMESVRTPP